MFHDTEEWCKVWRKTDSWFQKLHEEFGEFSHNHSKVAKFHFNGLFLSKAYDVWAKKIQRNYLSWHWTVMQNWNKPWPWVSKMGWGIGRILLEHLKSEKLYIDGLFLLKAYNVWAWKLKKNYVLWHWRVI